MEQAVTKSKATKKKKGKKNAGAADGGEEEEEVKLVDLLEIEKRMENKI